MAARWPSRSSRRPAQPPTSCVDDRLAAPFTADANDFLYQWESSRDYNASPGLERIQAALLAINSADDERNPPETGMMEREMKRVKNGRLFLIPASEDTRGHGTTGMAKFWKTAGAGASAVGRQAGDVALSRKRKRTPRRGARRPCARSPS